MYAPPKKVGLHAYFNNDAMGKQLPWYRKLLFFDQLKNLITNTKKNSVEKLVCLINNGAGTKIKSTALFKFLEKNSSFNKEVNPPMKEFLALLSNGNKQFTLNIIAALSFGRLGICSIPVRTNADNLVKIIAINTPYLDVGKAALNYFEVNFRSSTTLKILKEINENAICEDIGNAAGVLIKNLSIDVRSFSKSH